MKELKHRGGESRCSGHVRTFVSVRPAVMAAVVGCLIGAVCSSQVPMARAQAPTSLMGTWVAGDPQDESGPLIVVVFFDDSNYLFMQQGADVPDGSDGFEVGTYSWNPGTHAFQANVTADNNGESGFSHPSGAQRIETDGTQLNYLDEGSGDAASGTRLDPQAANPLVGTWFTTDMRCCTLAVLTFLDDVHFLFAQQGGDGDGQDGIERGTYTWNRSTKVFTPDVEIDTNGDKGLSSLGDTRCLDVDGDSLLYSEGTPCGVGDVLPLARVLNAAAATPTATPDATPTPSAPAELLVSGSCRQPGPEGLISCAAGTMVTVSRCNNSSCDPSNLTILGTTDVDAEGGFAFSLPREEAGGVRLIFTAAVADEFGSGGAVRGQAAPFTYSVIALGPAAANAQLDNVLIDPASVAATSELAAGGLENYSDATILQVIGLGQAANAGNTFAGQSVEDAVAMAQQTNASNSDFLSALGNTRPFCLGDCDDDRQVMVGELVTLVNISLDRLRLTACIPGNESADLQIAVNEIIRAVNAALSGCPV